MISPRPSTTYLKMAKNGGETLIPQEYKRDNRREEIGEISYIGQYAHYR